MFCFTVRWGIKKGIIHKYQPDAAVFRRQVRNVVLAKEYASRRRGEQAGDEV